MKYKNVEISELLNLDNYKTFSDQETDQELIYFEDLLFVNKELKKHVDVNVILEKLKVKQQNRRERLNKINDLEIKKEELQQLEFEDVDKKTNLFVKIKHKLQMKLINFQLNLIKKKTDEKRIESNDNITLIYNGEGELEAFEVSDNSNDHILHHIGLIENRLRNQLDQDFLAYRKEQRAKTYNRILNNLLYILIILYVVVVGIIKPRFLSSGSIINIVNQAAFRIPIAVGIAGVIVLTGTDLSAGRIIGLTALITASLLQRDDYAAKMFPGLGEVPILAVLLLVLIVGGIIGIANGFFVAKFKLHPFIVTLATGLIVYSISLMYINLGTNAGKPIGGLRPDFNESINGSLFGTSFRMYSIYVIILLVVVWFIWNKTTIGKNMYAVGSNPEAAEVNGISVFKTTIIMFMIAGILYGFNGFVTSAFVGSNNASTGQNFELDAIAAAVIGGVSFSGGVGKISGTVVGVILLQLITSSFIFLGIDANLQYLIKGGVILLATAIDMRKYIVKK